MSRFPIYDQIKTIVAQIDELDDQRLLLLADREKLRKMWYYRLGELRKSLPKGFLQIKSGFLGKADNVFLLVDVDDQNVDGKLSIKKISLKSIYDKIVIGECVEAHVEAFDENGEPRGRVMTESFATWDETCPKEAWTDINKCASTAVILPFAGECTKCLFMKPWLDLAHAIDSNACDSINALSICEKGLDSLLEEESAIDEAVRAKFTRNNNARSLRAKNKELIAVMNSHDWEDESESSRQLEKTFRATLVKMPLDDALVVYMMGARASWYYAWNWFVSHPQAENRVLQVA